jgi:putative adenylate-forming enzyme
MRIIWLLLAYWRARRLRFSTRAQLELHQARELAKFMRKLCARSSYFAPYRQLALTQWPVMDKASMMAHFDSMNTQALQLTHVMQVVKDAERSRDFSSMLGDITVGLSSGTSGQRGVFAVSSKEKAQWAGIMLAKALPKGLFNHERVALFLRANSNLYTAVRSRWLTFAFFDLFSPFDQLLKKLTDYRPSIIVAPAQVLRQLALAHIAGQLKVAPSRVISVAEVLEPQDRQLIEKAFGKPHEIYQATEGFLASTCEQGVLHLNEEYVHIEPQWLDAAQRRFVPIVTDFTRLTQPIVRYRLNDILVARTEPCKCGRVTRALDGIEGRWDDLLVLPAARETTMAIFADTLSRALAQALPLDADYRLVQDGAASLRLHAALDNPALEAVRDHLNQTLSRLGVNTAQLAWTLDPQLPAFDPATKRRRIIREEATHA